MEDSELGDSGSNTDQPEAEQLAENSCKCACSGRLSSPCLYCSCCASANAESSCKFSLVGNLQDLDFVGKGEENQFAVRPRSGGGFVLRIPGFRVDLQVESDIECLLREDVHEDVTRLFKRLAPNARTFALLPVLAEKVKDWVEFSADDAQYNELIIFLAVHMEPQYTTDATVLTGHSVLVKALNDISSIQCGSPGTNHPVDRSPWYMRAVLMGDSLNNAGADPQEQARIYKALCEHCATFRDEFNLTRLHGLSSTETEFVQPSCRDFFNKIAARECEWMETGFLSGQTAFRQGFREFCIPECIVNLIPEYIASKQPDGGLGFRSQKVLVFIPLVFIECKGVADTPTHGHFQAVDFAATMARILHAVRTNPKDLVTWAVGFTGEAIQFFSVRMVGTQPIVTQQTKPLSLLYEAQEVSRVLVKIIARCKDLAETISLPDSVDVTALPHQTPEDGNEGSFFFKKCPGDVLETLRPLCEELRRADMPDALTEQGHGKGYAVAFPVCYLSAKRLIEDERLGDVVFMSPHDPLGSTAVVYRNLKHKTAYHHGVTCLHELVQVCRAVALVHSTGWCHCDLYPSNIIFYKQTESGHTSLGQQRSAVLTENKPSPPPQSSPLRRSSKPEELSGDTTPVTPPGGTHRRQGSLSTNDNAPSKYTCCLIDLDAAKKLGTLYSPAMLKCLADNIEWSVTKWAYHPDLISPADGEVILVQEKFDWWPIAGMAVLLKDATDCARRAARAEPGTSWATWPEFSDEAEKKVKALCASLVAAEESGAENWEHVLKTAEEEEGQDGGDA